ncbi:uncharacterized protein LMH87_008921 [Akanthomyces muscarius]|uniref:Uncharacterized protein n=1 Tax=Akanthomyces muscarius TaxID=2231603 RepID=A0A9W8UNW3_AKAMU|nr:uncharacterized protein LMH87_008921 [Akanthomyces muscarius]KAJ4158394.1 hypothetical protein LMH87_008921 [Akanthomyces muscarius]
MMLPSSLFVAFSVLATTASSREGLHKATYGLLQVSPSFSGKGVSLYPAHHPDHDPYDLEHLTPKLENELYYSQEGHRPAMHGAKHSNMKAVFNHPTVVLDYSSHLTSLQCPASGIMKACFRPEAFEHVQSTWNISVLSIVTYHVGCGDEYNGQRSYFVAESLQFDVKSSCVSLNATSIDHEHALSSGEITWGTYEHPEYRKRVPVKGHVRVTRRTASQRETSSMYRRDDGNETEVDLDDLLGDPGTDDEADRGESIDLNNNGSALVDFFGTDNFDMSDIADPVPQDEDLDFIKEDGKVGTDEEENSPKRFRQRASPSLWDARDSHLRLEDRGIVEFFQGLYNGVKSFFQSIGDFFKQAVSLITSVGKIIVASAIVAAKLIAVPFGVPFDHSYHNDFRFTHNVVGEASNRPPKIFGYEDGFNLAGTGGIFSIQCAKCGVHGDFSVDGRLAFSLKDGITDGRVSLTNNDPFTVDAVFGITLEVQYDKSVKGFDKQIAAVPLSPLTIPGILTLGPQLALSGALDLVLNGKAELLIGGSLVMNPGTAALSLVKKEDNKLDGFQTTFTPVAKFTGTLTAAVELGLPVTLEVGIDVLNGKFKKTVGLVNKPSVYASASVTNDPDAKCNNGVELRAGVKNRIYVQALELWDYDIRTDILYEKGIACVTEDGFDTTAVEPDVSVFDTVSGKLDGADIANVTPQINDVAANLTSNHGTNVGFRIIMDEDKTSILVSGQDGHIYLVGTDELYDVSSPWGTIDLKSNGVNLDVFGRIMAYYPDKYARLIADVGMYEPDKVPDKERAAALVNLKTDDKDFGISTLLLTRNGKNALYYPTFCKTDKGLRLYGTYMVVDKNGQVRANSATVANIKRGLAQFGAGRPCRTVQLTTKLVD